MMLNTSSHPPLCINCRKSVDLEGSVSQLLSVQKLLLFQTYAEQLKVSQSPTIPTWWDFCEEDLPFCESCFQAVKQLRGLTCQLELVQRSIHEIITNFKIKILTSEKRRYPPSHHRHRDSIFRKLAVADFLPAILLPKVKPQEEKQTPCGDNGLKTEKLIVDSSVFQLKDHPLIEAPLNLDSFEEVARPSDLPAALLELYPKSDNWLHYTNSTLDSKTRRSYKTWKEKRSGGRTFISEIERARMETGQYKCRQCHQRRKKKRTRHIHTHLGEDTIKGAFLTGNG